MNEQNVILILGAGLLQKPAIESARALGYKTLVVDANPNAVCVPYADRFENIDLKNYKELKDLALSLGDSLKAVFTAGTDFSVSVAYVCEQLGIKNHSFESAVNATNKVHMRSCFAASGVPSPDFVQIDRSELSLYLDPKKINSIKFPKVIKPVDNMGARGCRIIRSKAEFLGAVEVALSNSRSGKAILEDYMEGPEFSIDALVYDGTVTITGFADRHIFYPPYFIETGHTMPSSVSQTQRLELIDCFVKGIEALGLSHGAAKADIKYTSKGPMIGEIAGRLSGGYMSGWTYPFASGMNLTEQAILIASGRKPEALLSSRMELPVKNKTFKVYEVPCTAVSAERAWISIPGTVKNIINLDVAMASPFTKNVFVRTREGSCVNFPRNNVEKCGNIINVAEDRQQAVHFAEQAVSNIVLRLEINNNETEKFLKREVQRTEDSFPPDAFTLEDSVFKKLQSELSHMPPVTSEKNTMDQLPEVLKPYADSIYDYNHRTIRRTLELFDHIMPFHIDLEPVSFFNALIRGGIQGILYVADSAVSCVQKKNRKARGEMSVLKTKTRKRSK